MTITYRINGRKVTEAKARKHVDAQVDAESNHHEMRGMFDAAKEQSQQGYIARDYVECYGITMRHANEEQS